jgi:hypothetical protein
MITIGSSLAPDRVDHHGGEQAGLVAAIAPAVVGALNDHGVSRFQQDLSLVEEEEVARRAGWS